MASFFGCGFARVAVKLSYIKPTGKVEYDHDNRLNNYLAVFQGHQERYEVDKHSYIKRSKSLVHHFGKWKLKTNKDKYTEHFNPNNWEKLPEHEKKQHSRTSCQACDVHHFPFQSLFPMWSYKENCITQQGIDNNIKSRILKPSCRGHVKVTKKAMKKATSQIYEKINAPFKDIFGVTFANAQTNVSELSLQDKKSHAEMKKEKRKKSRVDKSSIQEKWLEKDCDTMLATRQTYSQRQEQRLSLFFESPEEAQQRANKRKRQEEEGQRKKKRHSPSPDDLDFDKDGLLEKVNTMRDGERVSKTSNKTQIQKKGKKCKAALGLTNKQIK